MSQKIEGSLPAAATLRTAPVNPRAAAGASEDGKTRAVEASSGADSLRLTGQASGLQSLQRQLSAAPAVDGKRVDAVRQALQDGSYKINAEVIASRMIDLDQQLGQ